MEGDLLRINRWLLPLSWLYGLVVKLRNTLFDVGLLKSRSYPIPTICVGNLTVGGTGKTPHTEYLVRLLKQDYRVAVLSRGYKRKTKGYVLATAKSTVQEIGDEPWQMKQKFPDIYVAVDANRRRGIERLCSDEATRDVEVVLLDDAYQHRYVQAGLNILLVDYHRLITQDHLLPAGRLREPQQGKERAHMVVVTKCPADISPLEQTMIKHDLHLRPHQQLYFSTLCYDALRPLFSQGAERTLESLQDYESVMLLTAIGSPEQMLMDLSHHAKHITPLTFPDHHFFSETDIQTINQTFASLPEPKIIVTTEKDATRLINAKGFSGDVRSSLYVLPIQMQIMRNEAENFNSYITDYIHEKIKKGVSLEKSDFIS